MTYLKLNYENIKKDDKMSFFFILQLYYKHIKSKLQI